MSKVPPTINLSEKLRSEIKKFEYDNAEWEIVKDKGKEFNLIVKHGKTGTRSYTVIAKMVSEPSPSPTLERETIEAEFKTRLNALKEHLKNPEDREKLFTDMIGELQKLINSVSNKVIRDGFSDRLGNLKVAEEMYRDLLTPFNEFSIANEIYTRMNSVQRPRINLRRTEDPNCTDMYSPKIQSTYPLTNEVVESDTQATWEMKRRIGDISTAGTVYTVCKIAAETQDCSYIIKIMESNKATITQVNIVTVLNEVECQIMANKAGLSPSIHDVFFCLGYKLDHITGKSIITALNQEIVAENHILREGYEFPIVKLTKAPFDRLAPSDQLKEVGWCRRRPGSDRPYKCFTPYRRFYIIMDKMDITISSFLKTIKPLVDTFIYRKYADNLKEIGDRLLDRLHKLGIIHGDAHSSNFMFNFTKQASEILASSAEQQSKIPEDKRNDFFGSFPSLKIIDFGTGSMNVSEEVFENLKKLDYKKLSDTLLI